jgi:uncharacterized protein with ACT and thioredoxin-like domain
MLWPFLVHRRSLAAEPVSAQHVPVVGGEDDICVVRCKCMGSVNDTSDLTVNKAIAAEVEGKAQDTVF